LLGRLKTFAFIVAALLPTSGALGQGTGIPISADPSPTIKAEPAPPTARDESRFEVPGTFRLFGNLYATGQSQVDVTRSPIDFGPAWRLKSGISYTTFGGVQLSASVIARRGYSLPIAMAQPLGSDLQIFDPRNSSSEFGWRAIQWDTELRVRKTLTTSGLFDVTLVGEAFNLFNLHSPDDNTARAPTLTSPTVRAGAVLGF
jgi:hypothetical protein